MYKVSNNIAYDGSLCEFVLKELRSFIRGSTPGKLLPSENALMHKYNISRSTANKVLNILAHEGLVERQRGRGTLTASPQVITYLLPCPDFMSIDRAEAETSRLRYQGIMKAAKECNMQVETIAASRINDRNVLNYNLLNHINAGSMVITDIWYKMLFQYLYERKASVVMSNKEFVQYGFRQYTRRWHSFELSDRNNMIRTLECLSFMKCKRIGTAGIYLLNEPHLTFNAYKSWAEKHDMPVAVLDLTGKTPLPREELNNWCKVNKLDALIWIGPYNNGFETIQKMLGISSDITVFGWTFVPEYFPELAPFPCCMVPYEQMGYDAVKILAHRPRLTAVKRTYQYIFRNVPTEFATQENFNIQQ